MPKRRFGYNDWERIINKGNGSNLISFNTQDHIEKKIKAGASPRVMQKYRWFKNYIARAAEIYQEIRQSI